MKNTQKFAFTLVELLITITILALIAVVAFTSFWVRQNNAINSKVTSEIETLTNALLLAKQENNELPLPKGNLNFFAEDTSYVHSYTWSETFAVHGFITHDTLAKKYIDVLPVDPRTGAFYAYGKTKWSDTLDEMYEIAGIVWKNDSPISYVTWNYSAETGPYNLIRSYNWPDFIWDKSDSNFPYNPLERILTAKIDDYSGTVTINWNTYNNDKILNYELRTWDTIEVSSSWTVELYFSDWSRSVLWDTTQNTKLTLQKMDYKQENNLVTDVKLILESGMIWNKAASLDENSEFDIYTTDSTAAVRGTIFWVQKNIWNTQIVVKQGSVKVNKFIISNSIDDIKQAIDNQNIISLYPEHIAENVPWIIINADRESILEVLENNPEVWVQVNESPNNDWAIPEVSNTGSIDDIPNEIALEITENYPVFNDNINIEIQGYSYTDDDININLKVSEKIYNHADIIRIRWNDYPNYKIINNIRSLDKDITDESAVIITLKKDTSLNEWSVINDIVTNIHESWTNDVTSWKIETELVGDYLEFSDWENSQVFPTTTNDNWNAPIDLIDWIKGDNITELEISFGKYTTKGELRFTREINLVLVKNKSYNNEDEEEKRVEEVQDFEELSDPNIANRKQLCDGPNFVFQNSLWERECAYNTLGSDNWNLFAYAPYNGTWALYKKDGIISTQTNGATFDWWLRLSSSKYLKYYNEDLNLQASSDFAIEMKVKWSDLNRPTNHQLFKFWNISIYIKNSKIYNTHSTYWLINNLNNDVYYRVIFEYDKNDKNWVLYILDENNNFVSGEIYKNYEIISWDLLYVWSEYFNSGYVNQWESPINYLKIYKK